MKKIEFEGWKNCVEMKSGEFRLVITTDVGPRIIGAFLGKNPNMMCVKPETVGKTGGSEWKIYGGHRLWHSPEAKPRSYVPDNSKVEVVLKKDRAVFSSGTEKDTGICKSFSVKPLGKNSFEIRHSIVNRNMWTVEIAAWALTVMEKGGTAIIPVPKADPKGLLPNMYMTIWPYTNLADPRLVFGKDYILLKQDPKAKTPCKIGLNCEDGWIAYANKGTALIKKFEHLVDAEYPDNGCSIETYTCDFMLEIETLSPLYLLDPGEEIEHVEIWEAVSTEKEILTENDAKSAFKNVKR